jgi:hypothetical protein
MKSSLPPEPANYLGRSKSLSYVRAAAVTLVKSWQFTALINTVVFCLMKIGGLEWIIYHLSLLFAGHYT